MAVKRCPMCRRVNPDSAQRCDCAYEFGQEIPVVLQLLRDQKGRGWLWLVLGLVVVFLDVMFIIAAITGGFGFRIGFLVIVAAIIAIVRGTRLILRSRKSLRELEALAKLPEARVVQRR
jgi:hypothetical protein